MNTDLHQRNLPQSPAQSGAALCVAASHKQVHKLARVLNLRKFEMHGDVVHLLLLTIFLSPLDDSRPLHFDRVHTLSVKKQTKEWAGGERKR